MKKAENTTERINKQKIEKSRINDRGDNYSQNKFSVAQKLVPLYSNECINFTSKIKVM